MVYAIIVITTPREMFQNQKKKFSIWWKIIVVLVQPIALCHSLAGVTVAMDCI
ncbi:hypothetical protein COAQ111491_06355 [Comamonas aquatilis]